MTLSSRSLLRGLVSVRSWSLAHIWPVVDTLVADAVHIDAELFTYTALEGRVPVCIFYKGGEVSAPAVWDSFPAVVDVPVYSAFCSVPFSSGAPSRGDIVPRT